ncbi:MAG: aminotransferase class I/II-fold pyridoxal phosphate-dependent enzyme [Thermodesulfobacteriota bacterium]
MSRFRSVLEAAGHKFRTKGISPRVTGISISAIKEMPILAQQVPGAVSLGQGIPSFRTPAHIRAAVARALEGEDWIGKYSLQPGWPRLKEAVAASLGRDMDIAVNPATEVFISTGSMEALFAAMMAVVEPGGEVIMTAPNYASHVEQVLLAGGTVQWAPLIEENGWRLDLDAVRRAVGPKTRAVILCNPLNPTGTVFSEAEVRGLAEICLEKDIFLISDEAYNHMVYGRERPFSAVRLPELKDHLIACFSFSKKYAVTGWRVGYMYASAGVIDQCLKVHDAVSISAPTISQVAALAALEGPQDCVAEMVAELGARRDLMCRRLDELAPAFTYQKPEGAYYVFVRFNFPDMGSNDLALKLLFEARVITIPGQAFGPNGDRFIRLSFGGTREEINLAFDRIAEWLKARGEK